MKNTTGVEENILIIPLPNCKMIGKSLPVCVRPSALGTVGNQRQPEAPLVGWFTAG